ncbi:bifunctional tetrahydrofolate synthase/dihydrofolate synthase [Erwinia tracheiphila]|uniref:Dihydrofolate synthase/folylpolyglutamate synthase n=1 Tax=Erwinia tracheiphila TaxID=65700 RepID=A0A345CV11_9GAMM|nr:bifunctional tetrahydrofolate synthase/dihydrofolate synthase [Erwinia tracheiphila]AXF77278.1 bifunctional tetrahydrofolate synthase/dihydrofolate synthase [Erwinia tracheiphila]UIA84029.1 bifunctional tetrahydrofolate synthase/dihydrofolate synthase [Erwinia tracheiphila]UIA92611.1 bifunctional tetrahydrofolate synthase/dihydrofolate synthase [Erwinia tracheiphila]
MSENSGLHEWLSYIDSLHSQVIDMSLDRIRAAAKTLDILKPAPFIFLVGGTNGKGTTCHTLEKILQLSGHKVGVFSSPHMINYTETVRIQGNELADADHIAAFVAINKARQDSTLTPFEFNTLGAFWLLKQARVDIAIIEVGMGGRDDATNIIEPNVSVITNVALDHEDWLGKNTEAIGEIKAGIFRSGKPAVIGQATAPVSLLTYAQEIGAVIHQRENHWHVDVRDNHWAFRDADCEFVHLDIPKMPLDNVATAIAALHVSGLKFTPDALNEVILNANLPGRFQIKVNNPTVILDVAHNPHASAYLAERLSKFPIRGRYRFVIGMLNNKDIKTTVGHLSGLSDSWYCCGVQAGSRSSQPDDVAQYLPQAHTFPDVLAGWEAAKQEAEPDDVIVVCGSFFSVAPILNLLNSTSE